MERPLCTGQPYPWVGQTNQILSKSLIFHLTHIFVSCVDILFSHSQKKVIILQLFLEFEFAAQFVFVTQIQIFQFNTQYISRYIHGYKEIGHCLKIGEFIHYAQSS